MAKIRHRKHEKRRDFIPSREVSGGNVSSIIIGKIYSYGLFGCVMLTVTIFVMANILSPVSSVVILDFPATVPLNGSLKPNDDLQHGKKLQKSLRGAESTVTDHQGNLYTGVENGQIVKIEVGTNDGIGEGRVSVLQHSSNSRPLGLRLRGDLLYVADSYSGIYVINVMSGEKTAIVSSNDVQPPIMFADDLDITKDGETLYFTDASSIWNYHELVNIILEGRCTGRLFQVNLKSKVVKTTFTSLCFPNGVQLSLDETKLFVCETSRNRVRVIDITTFEFSRAIYLPGGPDNIRPSKRSGFWVGIPVLHDPAVNFLNYLPRFRNVIACLAGNVLMNAIKKQGVIVELDEEGNIIRSLYDLTGNTVHTVAHVTELDNRELLLSSYKAEGIVKIYDN